MLPTSHPLPPSFVHATLVALDLPRELAERYTAPSDSRATNDRDRHRCFMQPGPVQPNRAPAWPFPVQ